jgi:hypothetical protein
MKALTICNPYPYLILLPTSDPRHKRVENRTWPTNYRGTMYLHAGKSRQWLDLSDDGTRDEGYDIPLDAMPFGAVVATMDLVDCVRIERIRKGEYDGKYPWLREHIHASGPWCWVLDNIKPVGPHSWRGAQGLFDIDPVELARGVE